MPNLTTITVSSGQGSAGSGTVSTIDNMFTAAGTPSATNVQTVQASTANFNVVISSGTIASLSSGTVVVSSIAGGTITTVGAVTSVTSGTVAIANGANVASVKATNTAASSQDLALVVAISPNNPITTTAASNLMATVIASDGTNSTSVTSVATVLDGGHFYCNAATPRFVKIYNLSTAPTAGSTLVKFIIGVPPGASRDVTMGGAALSVGLGYTITGAVNSSDTTVVSSNDIVGIIEYR
jgi:hypothetical protein